MPITFTCTSCSRMLNAIDAAAGQSRRCPACRSTVRVPSSAFPAPPVSQNRWRSSASSLLATAKAAARTIRVASDAGIAEKSKVGTRESQPKKVPQNSQNKARMLTQTRRHPAPLFRPKRRWWMTKGEISSVWLYRALWVFLLVCPFSAVLRITQNVMEVDLSSAFFVAIAVFFFGQLWMFLVVWPGMVLQQARYRYFHNGTVGRFEAAQKVANNAERYSLLLSARDFLFRQRKSGPLFQARWKQNLALFIAYSVVHRSVRQHEGRLPPTRRLVEEYRATVAKMREREHLTYLTDDDVEHILGRVLALYDRLSKADRTTFFPVGELARAIDEDIRVSIFPYRYGNQEEHDLGIVLDAIFNIAMLLEDAYREAPQAVQIVSVREFAESKDFASRLMRFEQRFV